MTTRQLKLWGSPSYLEVALDRLHVHVTVLGVVLRDLPEAHVEVSVDMDEAGDLPDLGAVEVEVLPTDAGVSAVTGLEDDEAFRVGDSILVRPPWVDAPSGFDGVELVVPRGMAFGSGEHGSTQAALGMMERVFDDVSDAACFESLVDIGTGSGILAAYAAARGVPAIHACDIDADAVTAARALVPGADVRVGGPEVFPGNFDVVVANMRVGEIRGCLEAILEAWNRRGPLILSGLRPSEATWFDADVGRSAEGRVEVAGFVAVAWSPYRN